MKRDMIFALFAGLIAGILLLPTLINLKLSFPYEYIFLFIVLPLGSAFFIFFAKILIQRLPSLYQFAKFVVTGGLNFTLDFGVLNILILYTGIAAGVYYSLFKSISFITANINSYFWNKHWTFGSISRQGGTGEFVSFFVVSIVGFLINVGIASVIVSLVGPQFGLDGARWANVGAAVGAVAGLIWNFLGYKFLVFKS